MSKSIIINEQQVLACILSKPELLDLDSKNWFTNPISICIYESLRKLKLNSVSFTTSTIVSECAKTNNDVTHQIIEDIKTKVSYSINDFQYYLRRLREDYVKEDLQGRVLKVATGHLLTKGELNIPALQTTIEEIQNAIDAVEQKNVDLISFPQLLDEYEKELLNRASSNNFTSSGSRYLDKFLYGGGLEYGQICSLFGNSGNGKSIAELNLVNGKINKQEPTLYIPTEMGRFSTMDRLIAIRTGISIDELMKVDKETGTIPDYVYEAFKKEKSKLIRMKYFKLVDEPNISIPKLKKIILDMKKELNVKSITVVIDLASMMQEFEGDNKASKYEDALNKLFKVAREGHDAFVLIFQTKRSSDGVNVQNYEDCRKFIPKIESLKNSGAIEERSRIVISVYRQKYYGIRLLGKDDPEVMAADDILEMSILKQNNGPLATIKYLYDGPTAKLFYFEEGEK